MEIPSFGELLTSFPIVTISAGLIYFGWWLRGKSSKETVEAWKAFVEFMKTRGNRKDD